MPCNDARNYNLLLPDKQAYIHIHPVYMYLLIGLYIFPLFMYDQWNTGDRTRNST